MSASKAVKAMSFFDKWRRDHRELAQQQAQGGESPSASSLIRDALPSLPSISVGGAGSATKTPPKPKAENAPTPRIASRASLSASKSNVHINSASDKRNATRDPDEPDTDESYTVRDQIVAEEPALWDPPFTTTSATPEVSLKAPNSRRNRSARRTSPILGAHSSDDEAKHTEPISQNKQDTKQNVKDKGGDEKEAVGAKDGKVGSQKKYSLRSVVSHRPKPVEPNLFELLVRWASASDGPVETWEPEEMLHHDAPSALFAYWRRVGGREEHMQDPTLWYIEGVKTHRVLKGRVELSVSWVGSGELNWEPEGRVEDIAPEVLGEYWEKKGGRENCVEAGGKRKAGRPAKKGAAKRVRK